MKVIKKYLDLLECELVKVDGNTLIYNDLIEGEEVTTDFIKWCKDLIHNLNYKIQLDPNNLDIVRGLTRDIQEILEIIYLIHKEL